MMVDRPEPALPEGLEDNLSLHVLEFYWDGFEPALLCYDIVDHKRLTVQLDSAEFVVGTRKTCIGRFEGDRYIECPDSASVSKFSQCGECASEAYICHQDCVFDPECDGEACRYDPEGGGNEFCRREHVLYLAFYDKMVKVGLSSTRRIETRLIEQGADAYAIIGAFPNRLMAREAEKKLSSELALPQWIRQQTILANFVRPPDLDGIRAAYDGLKRSLGEGYGLSVEPLKLLSDYPLDLPLRSAPALQGTAGMHMGRLLGVKGKWLVYDSGELKALNLSDLPGRFLADKYLVKSLKTNK